MPINVPTTAPTRDPGPITCGLAVSGNHVQCIHITYISLYKHNVCWAIYPTGSRCIKNVKLISTTYYYKLVLHRIDAGAHLCDSAGNWYQLATLFKQHHYWSKEEFSCPSPVHTSTLNQFQISSKSVYHSCINTHNMLLKTSLCIPHDGCGLATNV